MNYFDKLRQLIKVYTRTSPSRTFDNSPFDQPVQRIAEAKNDYVFDNIARTLGSSLTRREALIAAATGLTGILLARFGINTAWAATSCICGGLQYDPQSACCTASGIVQKYPIINSSQCPNKVPHIYSCQGNGCGAQGGLHFPHQYGLASFLNACNTHDCCYGTCNSSKSDCDIDFFQAMENECKRAYPYHLFPHILPMCIQAANSYATAVIAFGKGAYDAAQIASCECCGTSTCGGLCTPDSYPCIGINDPVLNCCLNGYSCSGGAAGISKCCAPGDSPASDNFGIVHCCPPGTRGSNRNGGFSCEPFL